LLLFGEPKKKKEIPEKRTKFYSSNKKEDAKNLLS
jgi:hypothetical protein